MQAEINSFQLCEGMERKDKEGKPVMKREHGYVCLLYLTTRKLWCAGEMQRKIYYEI